MKNRLSLVQLIIIFVMLFSIVFGQSVKPANAAYSCFILPDRGTHTISGVANSYFPGVSTVSAGATSITVGPGRGANVNVQNGDLLLVVQMQDADINYNNTSAYGSGGTNGTGYANINNTGRYEFVVARGSMNFSVGGTINIEGKGSGTGLLYTYTNGDPVDPTPYPTATPRPGNPPTATPQPTATPPGGNYYAYHGQHRFQVIRVPAYLNTTLSGNVTAASWDGYTGGVVALETVNTLNLASYSIVVNGLGFRGGGGRQLTGGGGTYTDFVTSSLVYSKNGSKGEGIAGSPRYMFPAVGTATPTPLGVTDGYPSGSYARGAPGNAGGGGVDGNPAGNDQNSGGGGGGNGGAGGQGGYSWSTSRDSGGKGGASVIETIPGRIVLGGGGGAGTTNNGTGSPASGLASSGASGGGSVILRAGLIVNPGTIAANGANSLDVLNDSTGGGGAGGSVVVLTNGTALTGLSIAANGGNSGNAWPLQAPNGNPGERHGPGGGGGGGVVFTSSSATISVAGGLNGTTTNVHDAFGATPGGSGLSRTDITGTEIPGAESGFLCYSPTSVELKSIRARSTGDSGLLWKIVLAIGGLSLIGIWTFSRKR